MTNPEMKVTVGRIVYYRDDKDRTLAAIVAAVNGDGTINLGVFDRGGIPFSRTGVTLVAPGLTPRPGQAEWMPYQIGQAAKEKETAKEIIAPPTPSAPKISF